MEPPSSVRPPRGYCWMPTEALVPGMVIARPVFGGTGVNSVMQLAVGSEITANTIAQLVNKGVECVAVIQAGIQAGSDEATLAAAVRLYEARLTEIFGANPDPHCQRLLDALLIDGPSEC